MSGGTFGGALPRANQPPRRPARLWQTPHRPLAGTPFPPGRETGPHPRHRPAEHLRALVGDGARWGLQVEVVAEPLELTPAEARAKHIGANAAEWLAQPNDVSLIDSFPGLPEHPLFKSYANWFNALRAWLPHANAAGCNDATELKPGIWVSARARVSPAAELRAPCWIGPHTVVAANTIIGPMAVLEDRVMVESHVEISNSAVLPETFIGKMTELKNSVADGSILINWRSASCTRVPDAFLMCSLAKRRHVVKSTNWLARLAALLVLGLTLPLALIPILLAKLRRQPVTRPLRSPCGPIFPPKPA